MLDTLHALCILLGSEDTWWEHLYRSPVEWQLLLWTHQDRLPRGEISFHYHN